MCYNYFTDTIWYLALRTQEMVLDWKEYIEEGRVGCWQISSVKNKSIQAWFLKITSEKRVNENKLWNFSIICTDM